MVDSKLTRLRVLLLVSMQFFLAESLRKIHKQSSRKQKELRTGIEAAVAELEKVAATDSGPAHVAGARCCCCCCGCSYAGHHA